MKQMLKIVCFLSKFRDKKVSNINTTRNAHSLKRELRGALYQSLLEYALNTCTFASVTVRPELSLSKKGREAVDLINNFRCNQEDKKSTPWAQIFDSQADTVMFRYTPESLSSLFWISTRIYQWQQPDLPEDLCLLRPDKSELLVTNAHARSSYLVMTREEKLALVSQIPKLSKIIP